MTDDSSEEGDSHHPVQDIDVVDRFLTSCTNGDTWHVAECLASPRVKDHINPGLMEAARHGHLPVVDMLLAREDCDTNYRDKDGDTALSHCCASGQLSVATRLLSQSGININTCDIDQVTPLHKAIANHHLDIVRLLVSMDSLEMNVQNKYGFTALILAAGMGDTDIVSLLVSQPGVDVNMVESNHCSCMATVRLWGFC